jgi:hypothetical protein
LVPNQLISQWLPAKQQLHLATSTYRWYERNVHRHILPTLGRVSVRRLRHQQPRRSMTRCFIRPLVVG